MPQLNKRTMTLIRESEILPYDHPEERRFLFDQDGKQITNRIEHATLEALYAVCNELAIQVFGKFREGHEVVDVAFYRELVSEINDPSFKLARVTVEIMEEGTG